MRLEVLLAKQAEKDLERVPGYVASKLKAWVALILKVGLRETRAVKGYHDEPLHGDRAGQRSIRLSRSYRAFYRITQTGEVEIVLILEVNKHDY
ncbi:MAG: type II toxin-antitoxin system mRNA interferase toxin, RelE/StbE family [Deltaproteobacteria bacterium]|nr:type II toxin-antitoxin system mRNA interferase toxin, RelE/StbE family [Deltaproteobacteria bacterium]